MKGPWVKLWRSFLTDPTVQYCMKRYGHVTVTLLVALLTVTEDGIAVTPDDELAVLCNLEDDAFADLVNKIIARGIIFRNADGKICFRNWKKYQESESAERVRRFREKTDPTPSPASSNVTSPLQERYSNGECNGNVTGRSRSRGIEVEAEKEEKSAFFETPSSIAIKPDAATRIEKARAHWNELAPIIGPECRLMAIQFKPEDSSDCLRVMSVYSDDEIYEAMENYYDIKTSSEHDIKNRYQSMVGFLRGGVEKFVTSANPREEFRKRAKGFETAGEREDRERAEAIARLGIVEA